LAAFGVHLAAGVAASGVAAAVPLAAGLAGPGETLAFLALGTLGSLLPDLDADSSAPVRVSFNLAASTVAFVAMFLLAARFPSVAELIAVWVLTFLLVRWALFGALTRFTVHRGMLHSLPAAVVFGLATTVIADRGLEVGPVLAWMLGTFVTFGYLVHLVLDEVYAVNLFGARTRRSFGSALKLWSRRGMATTLALYLAGAGVVVLAPSPSPLVTTLGDPGVVRRLAHHLWPRAGWFALSSRVSGTARCALSRPTGNG
jgi:hypothetical protein